MVPADDRVVLLEGRSRPDLEPGQAAQTWIDRLEPAASGWWMRTRSSHHHRHHPEAAVRAAIARSGLGCRAVYGTHTSGVIEAPLDELVHAKAVYIARHTARRDH